MYVYGVCVCVGVYVRYVYVWVVVCMCGVCVYGGVCMCVRGVYGLNVCVGVYEEGMCVYVWVYVGRCVCILRGVYVWVYLCMYMYEGVVYIRVVCVWGGVRV